MLEDNIFGVSKGVLSDDELLHGALDKIIKDLDAMTDEELNMWLENVPYSGVGYAVSGMKDKEEICQNNH